MKYLHHLTGAILVSFLGVHPGYAMSRVAEQATHLNRSTVTQTTIDPHLSRISQSPTLIANRESNRIRLQQEAEAYRQRAEERRQRTEQRRQQAEDRRQRFEDRRQQIAERNRLEAERRRQYFESLSPEQQQAFLEEQMARRAQAEEAATIFIMEMLLESFRSGGGQSSGDQGSSYEIDDCLRLGIRSQACGTD